MKPCNPNKIEGLKPSWERKEYLRGYDAGIKELNYVLNKIKSELHATAEMHEDKEYYLRDKWIDEIIDKHIHIAESEE